MSYWLTTSMNVANKRKETLEFLDSKNQTFFLPNDKVWVTGRVEEEFKLVFKGIRHKFYRSRLISVRLSGEVDYIPIIISDEFVPDIEKQSFQNQFVEIGGVFQSDDEYDKYGKRHLRLFLYAKFIGICEEVLQNNIYLEGHIYKPPIFRKTPLGRIITDLIVAVNVPNLRKSFYIPCIAWGRIAVNTSTLWVGDHIAIYGRIQSREYFKKDFINSESGVKKTAYEISAVDVKVINEESGS